MIPGPIDFRGGLAAVVPDTGGYWLCRRERAVPGPVATSVWTNTPVLVGCLTELLGRRRIELDRAGRVADWATGRVVAPFEDGAI
jgi:hypothetical protein